MSAGGGLGDMGGGAMGGTGGGGIGGLGSVMGEYGGEHIVYTRPEGPPPSWLVSGLASVKASEELRKLLNERFDVETSHEDLNTTIAYLREIGIDVEVDSKGLQEDGIELHNVKGLSVAQGTMRELLMRALDAQGLTYRVLENHIQITTKDRAHQYPTICYYDLSFVQSSSKMLTDIINAIERSIEPDTWANNGGMSSIVPLGQILVIRSTESAHQEIERMLARLSQTLVENNTKGQASNKAGEKASSAQAAASGDLLGAPAESIAPKAKSDASSAKAGSDDPFGRSVNPKGATAGSDPFN
jgi:hypothetical protein